MSGSTLPPHEGRNAPIVVGTERFKINAERPKTATQGTLTEGIQGTVKAPARLAMTTQNAGGHNE